MRAHAHALARPRRCMIGTDSWPAPEAVPPSPAVDTPPPGHTSHDILTQALVSIRAGCSGRVGTVHSWYACLERCTVTSTVTEDESSVKVQCDEQRRYHIIRLQLQVQGSSLLRYAAVLHVSNCVNVQVKCISRVSLRRARTTLSSAQSGAMNTCAPRRCGGDNQRSVAPTLRV